MLSAIEAAFALGVGVFLIPLLKDVLPFLPLWSWQIISVVIVYVFVTVIAVLSWQRPVITVVWKSVEPGTPPLQDLHVRLDPSTKVSARYEVAFSGRPKGFITEWLMKRLRDHGLQLRFDPQGALAYVVVARSSRGRDGRQLHSAYADGFQMRVDTPPQPDTWMLANVNFQGRETMNQHFFTAVHDATAEGKRWKWLAEKLVRVESATKRVAFF